jgi:hypothetical protein
MKREGPKHRKLKEGSAAEERTESGEFEKKEDRKKGKDGKKGKGY